MTYIQVAAAELGPSRRCSIGCRSSQAGTARTVARHSAVAAAVAVLAARTIVALGTPA